MCPTSTETRPYLHGQVSDFVLLGGGSFIFLLLLRFGIGLDEAQSYSISIVLANIINHPHFAHSYQIFYRGFLKNVGSSESRLRSNYILVGIAIPALLGGLLTAVVAARSRAGLSLMMNLMIFTVGWHYAKQGYGIAMVDSILKKSFFSSSEKNKLLRNAYTTWLLSWALTTSALSGKEHRFWGISYATLKIPSPLIILIGVAAAVTAIDLLSCLLRRACNGSPIPWNGLSSYGVSLYPWLLWRDPVMILWYPMLHSLQYLAVVWRFEINRTRSIQSSVRPTLRLSLFLSLGLFLGYLGFWSIPLWLNSHFEFPKEVLGNNLFLFAFWIFINIHHYFMDSAMWKRENHEVADFLFNPSTLTCPTNTPSRAAVQKT